VKIVHFIVMGFASVAECRHAICGRGGVVLCSKDLWHVFWKLRIVLLLVDHVETGEQFWVCGFALLDVVEHLVDVAGHNFKSSDAKH